MVKPVFHLLELEGVPILEQLQLEEALLRADSRNWFLVNWGAPPAIVMGISGKPDRLVHLDQLEIPLIKRFSGGGTVVVDEETLFASFIGHQSILGTPLFPEPIMRWTGDFYSAALDHPGFSLRENDYVLAERKCAGNAQYIRKDRWLHHTTFLWDYCPNRMSLLKMPERAPTYRQGREHTDFITTLAPHFSSKNDLINKMIEQLHARFEVVETSLEEATQTLSFNHRKTTQQLL